MRGMVEPNIFRVLGGGVRVGVFGEMIYILCTISYFQMRGTGAADDMDHKDF